MQSGEHLEDAAPHQRGPSLHLSHLMGKLLSDSNTREHLLQPPMEMDKFLGSPDSDITSNSIGRQETITN